MQSQKGTPTPSTDGSSQPLVEGRLIKKTATSSTSSSEKSSSLAYKTAWQIGRAVLIAMALLWLFYLFFADWGAWTAAYLASLVVLLLGVPLVLASSGGLLTRALLFLAVAGAVLCLFLVRVWLTVHFTWRMEDESRLLAPPPGQEIVLSYPQMLPANGTPITLSVVNLSSAQITPLTVTFAADPQGLVIFSSLTGTLAEAAPGGSSVLGTLLNTQYAQDCIPPLGGQSLPSVLSWLEPPLRWAEVALGGQCLSKPVTPTVTLVGQLSGGGVTSILPITFTLQAERPERASIRQFAANGESTGSPLLVLIPSAVALIGYLVVRRQDQREKDRQLDERLAQENREAMSTLAKEEREAARTLAREEREAARTLAREERDAKDKEMAEIKTARAQAEERWTQWLDYMNQGKWVEAHELRVRLTDDLDYEQLADGERKRGILHDLAGLSESRQLPSKERLLELGEWEAQATAQALIAAGGSSGAEMRSTYLQLAEALYKQRRGNSLYCDDQRTGRLQSLIKQLEVVSTCEHAEYAKDNAERVAKYQDLSVRRFRANLRGTNPFLYSQAEHEDFSLWCDFMVYWSACPANRQLIGTNYATDKSGYPEARPGPVLIVGPPGSGKTALARADRARLFIGNPEPKGLWVMIHRQWDSREALAAAANELLAFTIKYPLYWLRPPAAQQEWLAQYWLSLLPRRQVLDLLGEARASLKQRSEESSKEEDDRSTADELAALQALYSTLKWADAMLPLDSTVFVSGLATAAGMIGFRKVHIFVDDLQVAPGMREVETLFRWREERINVYLLTSEQAVADAGVRSGLPSIEVSWEARDLWQMALNRFVQFTRPPTDGGAADRVQPGKIATKFEDVPENLPQQLNEWVGYKPINQLFTEGGWKRAIAVKQIDALPHMLCFWRKLLGVAAEGDEDTPFTEKDIAEAERKAFG